MEVTVERLSGGNDSTLGALFIDDKFACFTCEDQFQTKKVYGETRIPAGRYQLKLRREGRFHQRYAAKFPGFHLGMLWLQDVPGFEYVLIHIGNTDDDTAGCILVGFGGETNDQGGGKITNSTLAYTSIYPKIAIPLDRGQEVFINIVDRDRG